MLVLFWLGGLLAWAALVTLVVYLLMGELHVGDWLARRRETRK